MDAKLIVVKYGGSVLEDGIAFRKAAEAVKVERQAGVSVVVVVSALKGVTDMLLGAAGDISPDTPREVIDHIIGLGEEQSVRLMASALKSIGVEAVEVTPHSPSWPIVTDETYGDAEPIIEECELGTEIGVKPLIERGMVPVVCGFVGRSPDGNITTLGRGGSDTTAVILARCLGADELVLVKDVGGVYSADPKKVEGAKPIGELSAWEAHLLASSGAKVLHEKVFRYKPEGLKIMIVSKDDPLGGEGTVIDGTIPGIEVEVHERPVAKITVLGDLLSSPDDLNSITKIIGEAGGQMLSIKGTESSFTLIVEGLESGIDAVHSLVDTTSAVRALSERGELALITVRGAAYEDAYNVLSAIEELLADNGILRHGMITGQNWVQILVEWEQRDVVKENLEAALGDL